MRRERARTSRLRAILVLLRSRSSALPPLVVGERYVCRLGDPVGRLADLELVGTGHWVDNCGEGVFHHGETGVFLSASGDRIEIAREDVLWCREEHPAIVAAARSLGVPLVPSRRRAAPSWRLGAARLELGDMVSLGRLLTRGW
jgi:hypothetical protein